ncbi:MAG TPA: PKD domain-containing protein [Bacteroidales bacterium]|nr:PKD domain-containing protein [Bacteroidales bacterium]HSA44301.1 PKD domain-containing protein [Bacteroidales bacterium]
MRRLLSLTAVMLLPALVAGQNMYRPSDSEILKLPAWAKEMYGQQPNVWLVDSLYKAWFAVHPFVKSYHTQYYKRWRRSAEPYLDERGFAVIPSVEEMSARDGQYRQGLAAKDAVKSGQWQVLGPLQSLGNNGQKKGSQTNVYCIDQCASFPDILYCGTEPGEVYKSTDHGENWQCVTMEYDMGGGLTAIEVSPDNPDIVFAGSQHRLWRSLDGGVSWTSILQATDLGVNEILMIPSDQQVVLAATNKGLYRSTDGGAGFILMFTEKTYDIKANTANDNVLYLVRNNPALIRAECYRSDDKGATWMLKDQGWFASSDPDRHDGGARLAVTPADPMRVYAYLIGEAKANDYGFIGLYRSDDGGETWFLPNPPAGGPYSSAHPNTAYGMPSWTYHQGFYNCALMVSNDNPDQVLIGGLNLWRTDDGGYTFAAQAGYQGNVLQMHVDMQDFRAMSGEYWITNDGGIYWSDDFFGTTNLVKTTGVHGSDYWGFGSGWNEDVLVGGLYHNGNLAWYENYAQGDYLSLGGGEAPTGYVHPSENRRTYFSDIGGRILPQQIGDPILNFSMGMSPNETYWSAESSEMEFHPACYNIIFLGKENKLWKSVDRGVSYSLVQEFGTNVNSQVKYIEIAGSNPDVIYLSQQPASGTNGSLWKTTDGGAGWSQLTKPAGNSRKMLLAVSPEDENILWLAYPQGSNGSKIFKTTDGGLTWTNLSTATLNGESIHSMCHIGGTPGGVYLATGRTVYYRNDTMPDWMYFNDGLPSYINANIIRPFYRDGKLRMASYGKGIWESPLHGQQDKPVARIMVDKLGAVVHCATDTFHFDCYSMLNHQNASWQWTFQGGTPAGSTQRKAGVVFNSPGDHLVTLTVIDANGQSDTDSLVISLSNYLVPFTVNEGFEGNFPPLGWEVFNPDQDVTWTVSNTAGGFGWSARSSLFDNFNHDAQGKFDDLRFSINLSSAQQLRLVFDVAYAEYGGQYSDSLQILASTDCGLTNSLLYFKGGDSLATAPDNQNFFYPNFSQWRSDTVDLFSFAGNDDVVISFRNIGRYGNALYIDNPRVLTGTSAVPLQEYNQQYAAFFPNPVVAGDQLFLSSSERGPLRVEIWNLEGRQIKRCTLSAGESLAVDPALFTPGIYHYRISGSSLIQHGRLVVGGGR